MNVQWKRVVVWVGAFAVVVTLGVLWLLRFASHPPAPRPGAEWIGLPVTGMDASNSATRDVLLQMEAINTDGTHTDNPRNSLALRCGSRSDEQMTGETYVVLIGQSFLLPNREAWRAKFVVLDDQVEVTIQDARELVPQPPPSYPSEPGRKSDMTIAATPATKRLMLAKSTLQGVFDAWRNQSLWQTDQRPLECFYGPAAATVLLEACVANRYAARSRGCDAESVYAVNNLWVALHRSLALPISNTSVFPETY